MPPKWIVHYSLPWVALIVTSTQSRVFWEMGLLVCLLGGCLDAISHVGRLILTMGSLLSYQEILGYRRWRSWVSPKEQLFSDGCSAMWPDRYFMLLLFDFLTVEALYLQLWAQRSPFFFRLLSGCFSKTFYDNNMKRN